MIGRCLKKNNQALVSVLYRYPNRRFVPKKGAHAVGAKPEYVAENRLFTAVPGILPGDITET